MVDPDLRGDLKGILLVNDGFFQAIGVISFGMAALVVIKSSLLT